MYTYENICVYIFMSNYTYSCGRLQLVKSCCFLDMHLYSNSLSTIAMIFSLIMSELFAACFSCSNSFNLIQNSLGSDDKTIVFETPEAETIKPGL